MARNPLVGLAGLFGAVLGPAAVMAAGSMGTGSAASLLLAGAWFRYDLLWIVLLILPAFVISVDSASRAAVLRGGKGMFAIIRDEIHPGLMWSLLGLNVLVHLLVAMGQMSVMVSALLSLFGIYRPSSSAPLSELHSYRQWEMLLAALLALALLALLWSGTYRELQKWMTAVLLVMLACFVVVSLRGFSEWRDILQGLIPRIPPDLPVPGGGRRESLTTLLGIGGGTLSPASLLGFSYLTADNRSLPEDLGRDFRKAILNFGVIFGSYSVMVLVAGGFALYPLPQHARIAEVEQAGQVLTRALPEQWGFLGPKIFALGLFFCGLTTLVVIAQVMSYFLLDALNQPWRYTAENSPYKWLLALWILVPSLLAPVWDLPALLKVILLMSLNLVVVPVALSIILYLVNRREVMGAYRPERWRNALLLASLALSIWLALLKTPTYLRELAGG